MYLERSIANIHVGTVGLRAMPKESSWNVTSSLIALSLLTDRYFISKICAQALLNRYVFTLLKRL